MGEVSPSRPSLFIRIMRILYYVLSVAMIAMVSLEIARREVAHIGIGLLPFTYVRVLFGCAVFWLARRKNSSPGFVVRVLSAITYLALAAAMGILLAGLRLQFGKRERVGVTSKYPLGDEVTDTGTMAGVAFVLAVLEMIA